MTYIARLVLFSELRCQNETEERYIDSCPNDNQTKRVKFLTQASRQSNDSSIRTNDPYRIVHQKKR